MKKIIGILAFVALLTLGVAIGAGNAFWGYGGNMGSHHDTMEQLMEEGSYQDLSLYREQIGGNFMPFVTNEDTFLEMKEHHEFMEQFHENDENQRSFGNKGYGRQGGCMFS